MFLFSAQEAVQADPDSVHQDLSPKDRHQHLVRWIGFAGADLVEQLRSSVKF